MQLVVLGIKLLSVKKLVKFRRLVREFRCCWQMETEKRFTRQFQNISCNGLSLLWQWFIFPSVGMFPFYFSEVCN